MAVLAAQVERGEAAAVPQVVVALAHFAQELARPAEPLPGRLVEGSVAVLQMRKENRIIDICKTLNYRKRGKARLRESRLLPSCEAVKENYVDKVVGILWPHINSTWVTGSQNDMAMLS